MTLTQKAASNDLIPLADMSDVMLLTFGKSMMTRQDYVFNESLDESKNDSDDEWMDAQIEDAHQPLIEDVQQPFIRHEPLI